MRRIGVFVMFKIFKRDVIFKSDFFLFLLFFFLSLISYCIALPNDFLGDDILRIFYNHALSGEFGQAITDQLNDRPVLMFTHWLDALIFGIKPFEMRVVNLIIHSLVGVAFVKVAKKISSTPLDIGEKKILILFALIFVLHPLHNQSINIAIQRGVLLSTLFMLLSFLMYVDSLKNSKNQSYLLAILFYLLSINSKGITIVYPLILLCYHSVYKWSIKELKKIIPFFFTALIPVLYYSVLKINTQVNTLSAWEYFLVQTRAVFVYLKLFIIPYGLKYLYDFSKSSNPFDNYSWLAIIGHLVFIYLISKFYKTNKLAFFLFLSVYILLIPESSIFPIQHVAFEHRTYLPIVFLLLGLFFVCKKIVVENKKIQYGLVVLLFIYGALNWYRNIQISPPYKWVVHTIMSGSPDIIYNVVWGADLIAIQKYDEAKMVFSKLASDHPEIKDYELFKKASELHFVSKNQQIILLQEIAEGLRANFDLSYGSRIKLNMIVITELRKLVDEFRFNYLVEKLVTPQLELMKNRPERYVKILQIYSFSLNRLKKYYEANYSKLEPDGKIHSLSVRVLLVHYFQREDNDLKKSLIKALRENSQSQTLIYLNSLIK